MLFVFLGKKKKCFLVFVLLLVRTLKASSVFNKEGK